jgi:precorrin-2 dehydrogenase/sirohydrochlorin ferrochelatase
VTREPAVYPASLLLTGRPVLVVGGGRVAARKVAALLAAGADVTVVAPAVDPAITAGSARVERRRYRPGEVARYRLAVTATGDPQVDRLVYDDAERAGVFVNAADDPAACSFHVPAVVRRGPVTVAVSTAGASPALASFIRSRIEDVVGPEFASLAETLAAVRAEVRSRDIPTDLLDWNPLIADLLRVGPTTGEAAGAVARWLEDAVPVSPR